MRDHKDSSIMAINLEEFGAMKKSIENIENSLMTFRQDIRDGFHEVHKRIEDESSKREQQRKQSEEVALKVHKLYWAVAVIAGVATAIPVIRELAPILLKGLLTPNELSELITYLEMFTLYM